MNKVIALAATTVIIIGAFLTSMPESANAAQDSIACELPDTFKVIRAIRTTNGHVKIDGHLDESDWKRTPAASGFIQNEPHDGEPATERTDVWIIYDDEAIYVGIKAYDSKPDQITGRLTRRDGHTPSDWIHIGFDSYNDKRTAFGFSVNPVGVKQDRIWYNDTEEDENWNAVWDVATSIENDGWTAEFRIPFSQLRYSNNGKGNSWGFNVGREILRNNETSLWNPVPRDCNQLVSRFGRLEGIDDLPQARHLEILPYVVGKVDVYGDPDEADPFRNDAVWDPRLGADAKYRLTSNLTLDMTINPDFGQVEQDPSEFNLTAFETYFEERRPFFIEGANLFQYRLMFGDDNIEQLFYSRRVGRRPQFYALDSGRWENTDDFYENTPLFTKILGAAKVTGRTAGGWSIAVMDALTDKEKATVASPDGNRHGIIVEPMTNYFVGRTQKDFNNGRSTFGGIVTHVLRDIPTEDFQYLNRTALTGGIDFSHRWHNDDYSITANFMGSHIRGSEEAMLEAQTSSARYYQRPDAPHLSVDSTLTHMEGFAMNFWGGKFTGHWRYGLGLLSRSPGFEVNDIGFMRYSDANLGAIWIGYREWEPGRIVREWNLNGNIWNGWNYGGEQFGLGGNINGYMQFTNFWGLYSGVNRNQEHQDNGILRGGPALIVPGATAGWHGFHSDRRKSISFGYNGFIRISDEGWRSNSYSPHITIRPSGRFDFSLYPSYSKIENDLQYVDEIDGRYILGNLKMDEVAITLRMNLTMTRNLSIQFYGMPYIAAGRYSHFKEVVAPRADNYEDRFAPFDYLQYDNPDFNFKQFNSNLVFRWEYSPGSTIYFVWSRGATDYEEEHGEFDFNRDMNNLFSTAGDNTFLVKINKWFSL